MKEWSLISCQVFSDLNPVENPEVKRRSCESEGSGVILDEGMLSDLLSGVLQTHQALQQKTESCYLVRRTLQ